MDLVKAMFVSFKRHFITPKTTEIWGRTHPKCPLFYCTLPVDLGASNLPLCGELFTCAPWLGPVRAFTMGSIIVGAVGQERMVVGAVMWQLQCVTW